jgi:hypothetical protein
MPPLTSVLAGLVPAIHAEGRRLAFQMRYHGEAGTAGASSLAWLPSCARFVRTQGSPHCPSVRRASFDALSGARLRRRRFASSLTSTSSRAPLRHANNDGICRYFSSLAGWLRLYALTKQISPLFDPRRRRRVDRWDALRPDPSKRPRRAGRVKSAASWRRERSHAQLAFCKRAWRAPIF